MTGAYGHPFEVTQQAETNVTIGPRRVTLDASLIEHDRGWNLDPELPQLATHNR